MYQMDCDDNLHMMDDFWVFGYGSLMWRPGFDYTEQISARLRGLHRNLCVYSHVHRGTPERPGLVLGLDRGGACRGIAFRIEASRWEETIAYLRAREQVTMVYRECRRTVDLLDGSQRRINALCYVVDRRHPQYAGGLKLERQIEYVRQGSGRSGRNIDYVTNTVAHLAEMGIPDPRLETLARALETDASSGSDRRLAQGV
jgi:glutathione-specific gamma-glutamylcyclotransferase